jgi:hypothetical protein
VLVSTTDEKFDIFLSYKWENVDQVKILQEKLMKECGFTVWRDETNLKKSEALESQLAKNIQNSKVFLFCLTRAYYESKNCKSELRYAINVCKKPIVFLMLERLELINLDDVGFLLNSYIYVQGYKSKPLDAWPTNYFDEIRKNIENVMPVIKMKIFIFYILILIF